MAFFALLAFVLLGYGLVLPAVLALGVALAAPWAGICWRLLGPRH
ncbi:hypothetical protein [Ottowia beijingensis]